MPLPWRSSVVTPGSIGGFGSSTGLSTPNTSAIESSTPWPLLQSGSPATGMRGSPASSGSARQFDTPGYGCETGPGYQRSVIATGNDWRNGPLGFPSSISFQVSSVSSAISRAPYSAWPYSRWVNSSLSWIEWYDERSGSDVPTELCVKIVIAFDLRSTIRSIGPIQSGLISSLPFRNSPCSE